MNSEVLHRVKKPHLGPFSPEPPKDTALLLKQGPDGQTWVHRAAGRLEASTINKVLQGLQSSNPASLPASVQKVDSANRSPLFLACAASPTPSQHANQRLETIRTLVAFGDCTSESTENIEQGWSAVHWLAKHGDIASGEVIIRTGCPAFLPDFNGRFAIDIAGISGNGSFVKLLVHEYLTSRNTLPHLLADVERRKRMDQVHLTCLNSEYLRLKVAFWSLVYPDSGFTVGLLKCSENDDALVSRLTFPLPDLGGISILHAAACCHKVEPLQEIEKLFPLLKSRSDPQPLIDFSKDNEGSEWARTLQDHLSAFNKRKPEEKANWNMEDEEGNSPLHLAVQYRRKPCIEFLLSKGSNPFHENNLLLTPPQCSYDSEISRIFKAYFSQLRGTSSLTSQSARCCSRKRVYTEGTSTGPVQLFAAESQAFAQLCILVQQTKAKPMADRLASADRFDWVVRFLLEKGYQVAMVSNSSPDSLMALIRAPPSLLLKHSQDSARAPVHRKAQEKIAQDVSMLLDFPSLKREGTIASAYWLFNYTALRRLENAVFGNISCLFQYPILATISDDPISKIFQEVYGAELTQVFKTHRWLLARCLIACLLAVIPQVFLFFIKSPGYPAVTIPCAVAPFVFLIPPISRFEQAKHLRLFVPFLSLGMLVIQGGMWFLYNFLVKIVVNNPSFALDGFLRGLFGGCIVYLIKLAGDLSIDALIGTQNKQQPNLFVECDPSKLFISKLIISVPNSLLYFVYLIIVFPIVEATDQETQNRDLLTFYVYGFLLVFVILRSLIILLVGILQPILIKSAFNRLVSSSFTYQEPRVEEKNNQTRRAVISLPQSQQEAGDSWSPLPDFAELDSLRYYWHDPTSFLQASIIQTLFGLLVFFIVPGALWIVTAAVYVEILGFLKFSINRASMPAIDAINSSLDTRCKKCLVSPPIPKWMICATWFGSVWYYLYWNLDGVIRLEKWQEHASKVCVVAVLAALLLISCGIPSSWEEWKQMLRPDLQVSQYDQVAVPNDEQTHKETEPSIVRQEIEPSVPIREVEGLRQELQISLKANRELYDKIEKLVNVSREHYFNPGPLKSNLMTSAYKFIKNTLLSARAAKLAQVVPQPLCDASKSRLATLYLPKLDIFISEQEITDFLIKMDAESHETVRIPEYQEDAETGTVCKYTAPLDLTDYLLLMQDPEWQAKLDLYKSKDKLVDLIEEYKRKKGATWIAERKKSVKYWVKLERGNLTADVAETLFPKFKEMYTTFIGFVPDIQERETAVSKILNLQSTLSSLMKMFSVESLLLINTYFHFGFSLSPQAFSVPDLIRLVTSPATRKIAILMHECWKSSSPKDSLAQMFASAGLRDMFSAGSLQVVLDGIFTANSDEATTLQRAMDAPDFIGADNSQPVLIKQYANMMSKVTPAINRAKVN